MAYNIQIRPLAALEIIEAYDWYEFQKEGLGLDFLAEVETFYNILRNNPFTFSYYDKPVRQGAIKKFPYVIVYETVDQNVVIYSVFMSKQNPSKKRLL